MSRRVSSLVRPGRGCRASILRGAISDSPVSPGLYFPVPPLSPGREVGPTGVRFDVDVLTGTDHGGRRLYSVGPTRVELVGRLNTLYYSVSKISVVRNLTKQWFFMYRLCR